MQRRRSRAYAKVLKADDAAYANGLAENVAPLVAGLMGGFDAFVAPATTTGKNIAPRVAALLDVMQVSDILSVEGPKSFTRPIYAGNAIAHGRKRRRQAGDHRARHRLCSARPPAAARPRSKRSRAPGDAGLSSFARRRGRQVRAPRADQRQGDRLRRARAQGRRDLPVRARAAGRQAQCGDGREPRGGRCRLCAERLPGRPDRQDRRPRSSISRSAFPARSSISRG